MSFYYQSSHRNSVFQLSHLHEFGIIVYKTDYVHPKWAQLAPLSIQYQANGTEELLHWHAARTQRQIHTCHCREQRKVASVSIPNGGLVNSIQSAA